MVIIMSRIVCPDIKDVNLNFRYYSNELTQNNILIYMIVAYSARNRLYGFPMLAHLETAPYKYYCFYYFLLHFSVKIRNFCLELNSFHALAGICDAWRL